MKKYTVEQAEEMRLDYHRMGSVASTARKWKVSRDTLLCYLNPEYRKKQNARTNSYSKKNLKRRRGLVRSWRENNINRQLLISAKARAKVNSQLFELEAEDILVPSVCPVLGIKLKMSTGKVQPGSPSLDKIFPEKGYVKGNVRVISFRANTLKSDATIQELEKVLADLKRLS